MRYATSGLTLRNPAGTTRLFAAVGYRVRMRTGLGLPAHVTACLFDLDGVLTPTVDVHRAAWEATFNQILRAYADRTGAPFRPFDPGQDYYRYVDGKPRADGVRSFLASRGITLPEGTPDDPDQAETVNGVGNRKNTQLQARLREHGIAPYPGSVAYLRAATAAGLRRAVVSASANCREVVAAAGLSDLLEAGVDGLVARRDRLPGKPAPDTFLAAAAMLAVPPTQAAVFEDAIAGVAAGRAGEFGYVVGVDRAGEGTGQREALQANGADIVVHDLADLMTDGAADDS